MIDRNGSWAKCWAVFVGGGLMLLLNLNAAARPQRTVETKGMRIVLTIALPEIAPQGAALVQDAIWTIDSRTKALQKIDIEKKKVVSTIRLEMREPRSLAWDGKTFWIADNGTKMVHQFDPGTRAILRSFIVPLAAEDKRAVLEAVAWDGKDLWVGYFAGWSSRILRMNVESGEVIQSMFAEGHPAALASDGKSLWMISSNQGKYPGAVTQRTIMDDPVKMNLSQKFVGRTPGKDPAGIAFDGTYLWIIDRGLKALHKVAPF